MSSRALPRSLVKELGGVVGRQAVLTRPGELLPFESDGLTAYRATPAAVVFVHDTDQLRRVIAALHAARVPFVPRGAGTGLSGGALGEGRVVIELSRMNRILWIDAENRRARVQPGVVNSRLGEAAAEHGLMYAPDPSSQTACTLGGNVAENSGGPHCLKYGVTSNHVLALLVVTPEGEVVELSGPGSDYDLVGVFVGSEGTLGVCAEIEVRLVPQPAAVETLLAHFDAIDPAGHAVSAIIAAGILPAALEMIDRETLKAVEASVFAAGFPTDVAASLIVELDGPRAGLAEQAAEVEALLKANGARAVARAASEADRIKFWKARKSAFGAMGRLGSDLLVQDATVPRSRLPEILNRVYEVARKHDLVITNVFHAGDGNLHPNIPFDRRDPGMSERVEAASREIMEACVAVGGTITGEHGVGIDKRRYMPLIFSPDDLEAMRWVKEVFDPTGLCNPGKVLPDGPDGAASEARAASAHPSKDRREMAEIIESDFGSDCLVDDPESFVIDEQMARVAAAPATLQELSELMKRAAAAGWAVVPAGQGTWLTAGRPLRRFDLVVTTRRLDGAVDHQPDDLLVTVGAGTSLDDLNARLAEAGQWWPLDPLGTGSVGAAIASGASGPLAAAYGSPRDLVLGLAVVRADGRIVKAGGRVVKNVAGYDLVKLFTGSWGTLGIVAQAHLRLHALPRADTTRILVAERVNDLTVAAARLSLGDRLAPAALEILSPEAARALGVGDGLWVMAARWLGHESAVEDAVRSAEAGPVEVRSATARLWADVREFETRAHPVVVLRADFPIRATAEVARLAVSLGGGATPMLIASPMLGRMWIFVAGRYSAASEERRWALRVEELRRAVAKVGGGLRVERAPLALRRAVDPWGHPGPTLRLQRGLKAKFDPLGTLKPGFLFPEL